MTFQVDEAESGQRLDRLLAARSGVTRSRIQRWIEGGHVRVNGGTARASQRLHAGDRVALTPPPPEPSPLAPEAIALVVLHEDADLVVLDKPPGMVVHPAPGHSAGTLVNALLHHCRDLSGVGGVLRPGIVHRLDRGTSGVLVAAKNDLAHHGLAEQFRSHTVERVYRALVHGLPRASEGRVDRALGRHPHDRKRISVRTRSGREARSAWTVLERFPRSDVTWLEVRPETGRTHQIRVHLASTGLPIVGDPVYGRTRRARFGLERQALHAAALGFTHPRSGREMRFEAPPPTDLERALAEVAQRESGP